MDPTDLFLSDLFSAMTTPITLMVMLTMYYEGEFHSHRTALQLIAVSLHCPFSVLYHLKEALCIPQTQRWCLDPLQLDLGMQHVAIVVIAYSIAVQGPDSWILTVSAILSGMCGIFMLVKYPAHTQYQHAAQTAHSAESCHYQHFRHIAVAFFVLCLLSNALYTTHFLHLYLCVLWYLIGGVIFIYLKDTDWWAHGAMHICGAIVAWHLVKL
jgi:hypothetical protein